MTHTTSSLNPSSDRLDPADEAWLDGLLREAAADLAQEAAALDGVDFSAAVLAALPAQQLALSAAARPSAAARLLAWLMPLALGLAAAGLLWLLPEGLSAWGSPEALSLKGLERWLPPLALAVWLAWGSTQQALGAFEGR
ncbi:hypothetical protein [Paucibacter sp. DJ2R-2]|uniref:hypothetical protein n=1 Tax=Paucibacter sp. DJ2R-2 TaxID=2893558 RepID=UPI0021E3AE09|nr:hypothetical protein [Paucibacter sp. DJ2R-2]MCV2421329.1 hypothetical protein [Paucibacter sp. DJ4R-1]MCV2441216.1 hypothetical protein [Paucibacter sp. DJ2R-2]